MTLYLYLMNTEMSTTKENALWEEENLTEPEKNCLKSKELEQNGITKNTEINSIENQWNDTGKISGIYKIVNKINGKYYVGGSEKIIGYKGRWYNHRKSLNKNNHHCIGLQRAWNKYGEKNFEFIIVEHTDISELSMAEQKYLDIAKTEKEKCYNSTFNVIAFFRGKRHSNETKLKISKICKGKCCGINHHAYGTHMKDETKKKLSKSLIGKHSGENAYQYDKTIYNLFNNDSKETFTGTRYNFYKKYNLSPKGVFRLVNRKRKSYKRWVLIS